jgi:hypothetical protein
VKNKLNSSEDFLEDGGVGNAALRKIDVATNLFDVFSMTGRKIIKNSNAGATSGE